LRDLTGAPTEHYLKDELSFVIIEDAVKKEFCITASMPDYKHDDDKSM